MGSGYNMISSVTFIAARSYTVTWDVDGETTTEKYECGETPTWKGETPAKEGLTFVGWDKEPVPVIGDVTYTAQFATAYTVTFVSKDGAPIGSPVTVEEGDTVPAPTATWQGRMNQASTVWKDEAGNLYFWNNHSKYDDANVVTGWTDADGKPVDFKVTGNKTLTAWSHVVEISTITGWTNRDSDGTLQINTIQNTTYDLGAWDLSQFSAVKITYGFDPSGNSRITDKSILLLADTDKTGTPISSAAMIAVYASRADGPATVTLDLSSVDQSYTNLYLASNNSTNDATGCYRIEFVYAAPAADTPSETTPEA